MERKGLEESLSQSVAASVKAGPHPLNRHRANGTYYGKVKRLRIRDRKMANDLRDSWRENELIMCRRIPIDIDERENEVRRKVYREVL